MWDQIAIAAAAGVPSFIIAWMAHKRSKHVDAVSEQSGVATETRAGTAQIFDGLNKMISNLQEDNTNFRTDIENLRDRLDVISTERDGLRLEVNRLYLKYGDNGASLIPLAKAPAAQTS